MRLIEIICAVQWGLLGGISYYLQLDLAMAIWIGFNGTFLYLLVVN